MPAGSWGAPGGQQGAAWVTPGAGEAPGGGQRQKQQGAAGSGAPLPVPQCARSGGAAPSPASVEVACASGQHLPCTSSQALSSGFSEKRTGRDPRGRPPLLQEQPWAAAPGRIATQGPPLELQGAALGTGDLAACCQDAATASGGEGPAHGLWAPSRARFLGVPRPHVEGLSWGVLLTRPSLALAALQEQPRPWGYA